MTTEFSTERVPGYAHHAGMGDVKVPAGGVETRSRVLVVDDVADNRDVLVRRLLRRGFFVVEATGGHDALEKLSGRSFDIVLLDIMMPDLSGYEVLRKLRETRSDVELPVIMVSAKSHAEDVAESLRLGANDYVTKPVDFAAALGRIETQLARKRAADAEREQRLHASAHERLIGQISRAAFHDAMESARDGAALEGRELARL